MPDVSPDQNRRDAADLDGERLSLERVGAQGPRLPNANATVVFLRDKKHAGEGVELDDGVQRRIFGDERAGAHMPGGNDPLVVSAAPFGGDPRILAANAGAVFRRLRALDVGLGDLDVGLSLEDGGARGIQLCLRAHASLSKRGRSGELPAGDNECAFGFGEVGAGDGEGGRRLGRELPQLVVL